MFYRPKKILSDRGQQAFSLLEIMVAVALLLIITVGLLAMFYQTQRAFRAGVNQKDVMEGARSTVELLSRELQQMTLGGVDLATNFSQVSPTDQFQNMNAETRTNRTFDLTFLRKENNDWISTTYWVSNPPAGTLYRVLRKTNVFEYLNDRSTGDQKVMDGVIHFQVLPYDTNGFLFVSTTNDDITLSPQKVEFRNRELPAFIDLELAVLEESTLKKFRARPDAQKLAYLTNQIGRVHVFRQRIPIRSTR